MGQKAAKRKSEVTHCLSKNIYQSCGLDWRGGSNEGKKYSQHQTSNLKGEILKKKYYDILMKDTSTMSETQLEDHQAFYKIIRHKLGI